MVAFECLDLENSFLVCGYIFITYKSSSYIKVIDYLVKGQGKGQKRKKHEI